MKLIAYRHLLPPYNVILVGLAYFDRTRPLRWKGACLKKTVAGYEVIIPVAGLPAEQIADLIDHDAPQRPTVVLSEENGRLTANTARDDITDSAGETIFAASREAFIAHVIVQERAKGYLAQMTKRAGVDVPDEDIKVIDSSTDLPVDLCALGVSETIIEDWYYDAWELMDDGKIECNMPKARSIHMNSIRAERDILLEKESGSKYRQPPEIESMFTPKRRETLKGLRDLPTTFDLTVYMTPQSLLAAWPNGLPRHKKP